jgi:hypothetical protein
MALVILDMRDTTGISPVTTPTPYMSLIAIKMGMR